MILRDPRDDPYGKLGKRAAARLEGKTKTLGACHKCGASLGRNRSSPRARYCVRCGTIYHTYDCGKRMAAVLLANDPTVCPKVRRGNLSADHQLASYVDNQTFFTQSSQENVSPPLNPKLCSDVRLVLQRLSLRVWTPRVSPVQA